MKRNHLFLHHLYFGKKLVIKTELLPYHVLGVHKYAAMGIRYPLEGVKPMDAELCGKLQKEFFN